MFTGCGLWFCTGERVEVLRLEEEQATAVSVQVRRTGNGGSVQVRRTGNGGFSTGKRFELRAKRQDG
jgi:hypothetical protein